MHFRRLISAMTIVFLVVVSGVGSFVSSALADSMVSITSDTAVYLTDTGVTLILVSGSTLVSYSVDATTLTVNLDAGSTVTVKSSGLYTLTNSQSSPTHCSGAAYSYLSLTAESPMAVTVMPATTLACTSSGGGGSGVAITPPDVGSFSASPATIRPGQASRLSWTITGVSSVSITPVVSTGSLSSLSGTTTVAPASTTTYTLIASNAYGQSVTATATVTVLAGDSGLGTPASEPAHCLVNHAGTFFLILNGVRRGIANPGLLFSYGYSFNDAVTDTAVYQHLPIGDLLGPNDGALVKTGQDPTVYLISGQTRHGFVSAEVFSAIGYKFSSVVTIPAAQLDGLPKGPEIADPAARHLSGAQIDSQGTVYHVTETARRPYPSLAVYNTWNLKDDFSRVVPANATDLDLPVGIEMAPRTNCSSE